MSHLKIYLDNNAATLIDPAVQQTIVDYLKQGQANPSSVHYYGQTARGILNQSRGIIAKFLGVRPDEICFTSGATEGLHAVIKGILDDAPTSHVITSDQEHACVYQLLKNYEKRGTPINWLSSGQGSISVEELKKAIRPDTKLIVLMAVNNETGVKNPITEIAKIASMYRIPFIVDGVAWLGKELFSVPAGVSAICFSGHKVHAPAGVGFTVIRPPFKTQPLLVGGAQEFGRRAGSENMLGIVALAKGIELLKESLPQATTHMTLLRDRLEEGILKELSNVSVNGLGPRICNTTNLAFENIDGESLLMSLDQAGIAVSHGSACSSGALEPSRVLLNMGIPLKLARASLRYSVSRMNTLEEIDKAVETTVRIVNKLRKNNSNSSS